MADETCTYAAEQSADNFLEPGKEPATSRSEEARGWISSVLGEKVEGPIAEALKDGVILFRLAKALDPLSMKGKPYTGGQPWSKFKEMENVTAFIQFCRRIGVPDFENFNTVDL